LHSMLSGPYSAHGSGRLFWTHAPADATPASDPPASAICRTRSFHPMSLDVHAIVGAPSVRFLTYSTAETRDPVFAMRPLCGTLLLLILAAAAAACTGPCGPDGSGDPCLCQGSGTIACADKNACEEKKAANGKATSSPRPAGPALFARYRRTQRRAIARQIK
jgi:hypothetical protein